MIERFCQGAGAHSVDANPARSGVARRLCGLRTFRSRLVRRLRRHVGRSAGAGVAAQRPGHSVLGAGAVRRARAAGGARRQGTGTTGSGAAARKGVRGRARRTAFAGCSVGTGARAEPTRGGAAPGRRSGASLGVGSYPMAAQLPSGAGVASGARGARFGGLDTRRARSQPEGAGDHDARPCRGLGSTGECRGSAGRRRADHRCDGLRVGARATARRVADTWRSGYLCCLTPGNLREHWRSARRRTSVADTHPNRKFGGGASDV